MGTYTIQSGDTLAKIAQDWGTTVEDIAKQNNISDVNMIMAGAQLNIGNDGAPVNTAPITNNSVVEEVDLSDSVDTGETSYTVQGGDTLSKIASQYGVSVEDIAKWNNISDVNMIYTGDVLVIKPATDKMTEQSNIQSDNGSQVEPEVLAPPDSGPTTLSTPVETLDVTAPINTQSVQDASGLNCSYSGYVRHKRSASAESIAAQGVLTYDNPKYIIGDVTGNGCLSKTDYIYFVGQVCGEGALDSDDQLGVATTILNNMEYMNCDIKKTLQTSYWPWGKTCDKYINYDNQGNPCGFKTIEQLGSAEYEKLQQVIRVVADAMNGVRNLNKETRFYAGDGLHNYFSDSYL